jgi:hypothetical protein
MPRGVSTIPQGGGGGAGKFINRVRLRDKFEAEQVRFLTEHDDIYWEECHRFQQSVGNQGKSVWMTRVCPAVIGQPCIRCNNGDKRGNVWFAWVFSDFVDLAQPGENRAVVKVGQLQRYRLQTNEVRLAQFSAAHKEMLDEVIAQFGTVTDRDYRILRRSEAGNKKPSYTMQPAGEPCERPELEEFLSKLPDLEDVAFGKIEKLNFGEEPETVKVGAEEAGPVAELAADGVGSDEAPMDPDDPFQGSGDF